VPASATNAPVLELVQLSDTHLLAEAQGELLGLETRDSLRYVVDLVRQTRPRLDLVLATGDLSQDGSVASYQHLRRQLEPLGAPMRWCPGNHDVREAMHQVAGDTALMSPVTDLGIWRIIVLDSQAPGEVSGFLAADQLALLEQALAEAAERYCLICLHHHPVAMGSRWMDDIGLRNADALFEVLDRHACVKALLWGHVHQEFDRERKGARLLASPSTCVQFEPGQENFQLAMKAPGYRWLQLYADGRIETGVLRVTAVEFRVDEGVTGY